MINALESSWALLTEPNQDLPSPEQRQAQFLSSLLLFFLLAGLSLVGAGLALAPTGARLELWNTAAVITAVFLPLYILSRTAYYHLAAVFSSFALSAFILVLALFTMAQPLLLTTLVIPLLLASVLLSLRATAALALTTIVVLLVALFSAGEPMSILRPFSFYVLTAGVIYLSAYQRGRVQAEQESVLRESESRFRILSERALVGIYITQDGLFRYVNPAMAQMFGFEPHEIIDRLGPLDLTMPEDQHRVMNYIWDRLTGHTDAANYILQGKRKDGTRIECEVLGRVMQYQGRPALIGMLIDITERQQMERAEQNQRAFLEALRDTAAVLNSTLDLDQVLERILDNVGRVVSHDGANVMLLEGDRVRVVRCQGQYDILGITDAVMKLTFDIHEAANFKTMAETHRPYIINNTYDDATWLQVPETSWVRSYAGAPISHGDDVIGFLNLDSMQAGFFTEAHGERLMAFADQVAIAIRNARLYQELERYNEALEEAVATRTIELRRTTEQVEVILNNSPDAVILLHTDGSVRMANPAFYDMFGYQEQEVLDQPLSPFISQNGEARFAKALDAVLQRGKRSRMALTAQRKDGTSFDADVALAPVTDDGHVRGGVCSLHDISSLKEVDRMKDAFVSNVSHELRTPITSLRLYHDLLKRNPDKHDVYLQRQEREIQRLNTIIEDLLRLSRLDRGQLDVSLKPVALNELVADYVLDRRPLAAERGLELFWEPSSQPMNVNADRGLLEQVIGIILTNAFNYTTLNSAVTVATASAQRDGQLWATCMVCDNGPGLNPRELPQLFNRFFRGAAARDSGTPGTGLGLAIAREIIERHDGFIEATNKNGPETGAIFTIWLPAL